MDQAQISPISALPEDKGQEARHKMDEVREIAQTYQLLNGHPDGPVQEHLGDHLVRRYTLSQGALEGVMESFDAHGQRESLLFFKANQLHGRCTYCTAGRVILEINFEEGVQQGLMKTYHGNGLLQSCVMYENGQMEGLFQIFDERGRLVRVSPYVKGQLEGEVVTYFMDGKTPSARQTYKANLLEGPSFSYDEKSHVLTENTYKSGLLDGKQLSYHPPLGDQDPLVSIESTYSMGICQEEKRYDEQGRSLDSHEVLGELTPAQKADQENRKEA